MPYTPSAEAPAWAFTALDLHVGCNEEGGVDAVFVDVVAAAAVDEDDDDDVVVIARLRAPPPPLIIKGVDFEYDC